MKRSHDRQKEAEISGRKISNKSSTVFLELYEKYSREPEFHFESEISIFNGTIVSLNLHGENPEGVLMENAELYRTQKAIFDLAWLGATSFVT